MPFKSKVSQSLVPGSLDFYCEKRIRLLSVQLSPKHEKLIFSRRVLVFVRKPQLMKAYSRLVKVAVK